MTRRAGPVADLGIGTGRFDSTTESPKYAHGPIKVSPPIAPW